MSVSVHGCENEYSGSYEEMRDPFQVVHMRDYTEELEVFLETYVNTHSFSFVREEPRAFASRLHKIFSLFSFPSTEELFFEGLRVKTLYSLWNVVIDDITDYTERGIDNILDCLQILIKSRRRKNFRGKTDAGQIICDIVQHFHNLPSGPNKNIAEDLLFLDLMRILNGFDYERIIHENHRDWMGTLPEYMEFVTVITDVRVFLDIDIAIYPNNLSLSTIGDLRGAYRWFEMAVRLSSDIATFDREYFTEASHNAVILYGQEKGHLPRNVLKVDKKHKEQLFETVIPSLMSEIREKGEEYLSRSKECLKKIDEIDTSNISRAFEIMFEKYPGQIDFAPPSNK